MTHLKTLVSSKALKVPRKERVWIMKSSPGPHKGDESIPIGVLLREYLGLADNRKEVRYILHKNEVLVDGRRVKDEKFPVGLLDVVALPGTDKYYLISVDSNARLCPQEIDKKKASEKLCKLSGKTMLKGGKLQLNFYDGKNLLADAKDSKKYGVGDTLVLSLPELKITAVLSKDKGKMALVAKGRHAGKIGKIINITESGLNLKSLTTVDVDGEKLVTNTDYIFIVGDKESKI